MVTRLGEFSLIGRCFLGIVLKITEMHMYVTQIIGRLFSTVHKSNVLISAKYGLSTIVGDFFESSSGHPGMTQSPL
jgi:hypothetical protein